ncbi:hypothetical protein ElyMa_005005600 [Elysia marginata]|uniref:Uncharacterized protein n=1 Tax=Elysia marginata TaxID=1093978 RepID=A0AAV4J9Q4_9GAST|nr:hypothetical protein ElyMa_005005600 [Elysia marginata]
MCLPDHLLPKASGASLASLLVVLMEYPLPGPVIALLSQEKAALAPKSYLISSCKKSIKITLVYAKDQQSEEQQLVPAAVAAAAAASVPAAAFEATAASTSKASSASSLLSSSSSLSSSAERKKPRHASSSSKTSRKKKKKKGKSSRKSSRSTPSGIMLPRVSKLSESSTSPTSDLEAFCSGARANNSGDRNHTVAPPKQNDTLERDEDSCSTPEFPLLFGGHNEDMIGRERMSTVDSGVPSSNGTMAYEQTAESGASDEDHDVNETVETKSSRAEPSLRRERPSMLSTSRERMKPERGQTFTKKDNEGHRVLPVDLPRRTRGISDSSISSFSSSDENDKEKALKKTKDTKSNTQTFAGGAASFSRMGGGSETPLRREDQWQTWTRIPRTQAPPTATRQKSMAVPLVSNTSHRSASASSAGVSGASRGSTQNNPSGVAATRNGANQNEGGASWDGAENL